MPQLLWDSSALIKQYLPEPGRASVNALFALSPAVPMAATYLTYAETAAALRRNVNAGNIQPAAFNSARVLLDSMVLNNPDFLLLSVDDAAVLAGVTLTDVHNLNSTDAAILAAYLRYARSQPAGNPVCVLVASDQRMIRTANAEGLQTFNPEAVAAADVAAALAAIG